MRGWKICGRANLPFDGFASNQDELLGAWLAKEPVHDIYLAERRARRGCS